MENAQEAEASIFSDPIEEPLMVFNGEGSGEESYVGNEEKKKIFFFGQPGCLNHSPIKTNANENHNNHTNPAEGQSAGEITKMSSSEQGKAENQDRAVSDDEDGDSLLQKISEALGEELEKNSPGTEMKEPSSELKTEINLELKTEPSQASSNVDLKLS